MAVSYVLYGGSSADQLVIVDPATGAQKPVPGGTAGVWTSYAPGSGTAVVDLLDESGGAVTHVTADAAGGYRIQCPADDGTPTLYLDPGLPSGQRFPIWPMNLASQVAGLAVTVATLLAGGTVTPPTDPGTPTGPTVTGPTDLTGTPGDGQVALSWTAGAPAGLTYLLELQVGSSWSTVYTGTAATFTATGLTDGQPSTFRVAAYESGSSGTLTAASTVTVIPVAPAPTGEPTATAPMNVLATPGDGQLTVTWDAPAMSSQAPDYYVVRSRVSPSGAWSTSMGDTASATPPLTHTITGLTDGTAYDVRVAAEMFYTVPAQGGNGTTTTGVYGDYSDPVTATPVASSAPSTASAPAGLTATLGNTAAALSWTAPTDNTAAITDYRVSYRVDPDGPVQIFAHAASTALSQTITGLTNGTLYDVGVAAVMGATVGTFAYGTVTPDGFDHADISHPATDIVATPADGALVVTWTPTVDGDYVEGPGVRYRISPDGAWVDESFNVNRSEDTATYTIPGLTNGTAYDVQVFYYDGNSLPGDYADPVTGTPSA